MRLSSTSLKPFTSSPSDKNMRREVQDSAVIHINPQDDSQVRMSSPSTFRKVSRDDLNRLHMLSAMAQDLRATLASIGRGEASLTRYHQYMQHAKVEVDKLISSLPENDHMCHIRSCWDQIKTCPLMDCHQDVTAHEQTELLNILDTKCRQIVYWSSYWTIPDRLQEMLKHTRPGYTIPFHALFEDEMPDTADRQKVLNYLAWSPKDLTGGLVDPESGLVYRYEEANFRRLLSFFWLFIALVGSTSFVVVGSLLPPLNGSIDLTPLLLGWLAVLIGTLVHVGIGVAQRFRTRGVNPGALPVSILPVMINARLGQLMLKIGMTLVAYCALVYASRHALQNDFDTFLLNAFLIGYSLDSIVELLGIGMEQRVAVQQASLRKLFWIKD
jgi:hypothetical protein